MLSRRQYTVPLAAIAILSLIVFSPYLSATLSGSNAFSTEVGFYDVSPKGESAGKIIPASCESGFEHTPGICGPACVGNVGSACSSSPNVCGQTNPGYVQCNGTCGFASPYPVSDNSTYWNFPAGHPGSNDSYPTREMGYGADTCDAAERTPYDCPAGANASCADVYQWWEYGRWARDVHCRSGYTAISPPSNNGCASLTVTPSSASVTRGATTQLRAFYDPDGPDPQPSFEVTGSANWISDNPTIASVNNTVSKGLVAGENSGSANIVSSYGGASGFANVRVTASFLQRLREILPGF